MDTLQPEAIGLHTWEKHTYIYNFKAVEMASVFNALYNVISMLRRVPFHTVGAFWPVNQILLPEPRPDNTAESDFTPRAQTRAQLRLISLPEPRPRAQQISLQDSRLEHS